MYVIAALAVVVLVAAVGLVTVSGSRKKVRVAVAAFHAAHRSTVSAATAAGITVGQAVAAYRYESDDVDPSPLRIVPERGHLAAADAAGETLTSIAELSKVAAFLPAGESAGDISAATDGDWTAADDVLAAAAVYEEADTALGVSHPYPRVDSDPTEA